MFKKLKEKLGILSRAMKNTQEKLKLSIQRFKKKMSEIRYLLARICKI